MLAEARRAPVDRRRAPSILSGVPTWRSQPNAGCSTPTTMSRATRVLVVERLLDRVHRTAGHEAAQALEPAPPCVSPAELRGEDRRSARRDGGSGRRSVREARIVAQVEARHALAERAPELLLQAHHHDASRRRSGRSARGRGSDARRRRCAAAASRGSASSRRGSSASTARCRRGSRRGRSRRPVRCAWCRPIISASVDRIPAEKSTTETPQRSGGPSGAPVRLMKPAYAWITKS